MERYVAGTSLVSTMPALVASRANQPFAAALSPEQGASGNREREKLGVVLAMTGDQHGECRNGRECEPCPGGPHRGTQRGDGPQDQKQRGYQIAGHCIESGTVAKDAEQCLQSGLLRSKAKECASASKESRTAHNGVNYSSFGKLNYPCNSSE